MNLSPSTASAVAGAIAKSLADYDPSTLIGLSCLARGADSIFADEVLNSGGRLEVYLPSINYREAKVKAADTARFDRLAKQANLVHVMPFNDAGRESYEAANEAILASCDRLFAVWDGKLPVDRGGTGSVVQSARSRGIPVDIFWPDGASRI